MMSSKLRLPSSLGFFEVPLVVIQMLQMINDRSSGEDGRANAQA